MTKNQATCVWSRLTLTWNTSSFQTTPPVLLWKLRGADFQYEGVFISITLFGHYQIHHFNHQQFMKLLSSLSLDMITFSLISSCQSTSLWRCFLPVLHMIIDHMDNWTSHWPSISLWRSCPPSCWWLSPSSPPARDARQHHYLLLVIIPELIFVCENFFPEYRIFFCFQFLVVGRLCATVHLYSIVSSICPSLLQWKLYWLSWQSFKLMHRARGKFLPPLICFFFR